MIIPELPNYLTSLGGAEYKGLIISLFTVTALLSRPFSGKLADKIGRVPVMMFGSGICLLCGLMYPVVSSVFGFLLLRFVHGFSTGFTPTGQTAYLSDIVPANKRGEAMGLLGTAGTVGMAAGPTIGGALANQFSLEVMFYCSSLFGVLSIVILFGIKETLDQKNPFSVSMLKIKRHDIFETRVLIPCIIMLMSAYAYGTFLTVIPDFGEHLGIKNKGGMFAYFTMASLMVRLLAGKASDRYGRKKVVRLSISMIVLAMIVVATATTPFALLAGITLYGLGHGMTSPTLLAWAADLSDEKQKGKGLASLYMFMELGIGIGALVSADIYQNKTTHFVWTFLACSALSAVAFIYLMFVKSGARPQHEAH